MLVKDPAAVDLPWRPDKENLQKQLLERLQTLNDLREAWHLRYLTPMRSVPIPDSLQGPDSIRPPFDAAFYFTNMFRAYEFCTFQTNCILLFMLYQDLSPENLQPIEDLFPGLFPNGSVRELARNICRCTEYLCLEKNGSRGYIVLQLPATIAYFAIDKNTPEAKWLYTVCKKRARSSGFGWGDFAMDQVTPLSKWMASCRDRRSTLDSKERAMVTVNVSSQSEAALPMRGSRRPEDAVWHPP